VDNTSLIPCFTARALVVFSGESVWLASSNRILAEPQWPSCLSVLYRQLPSSSRATLCLL